jgi:hypothetical protein
MSAITRDEWIKVFDGTHPTFRQSPPSKCFSTSATLAPSPAAPAAVTSPIMKQFLIVSIHRLDRYILAFGHDLPLCISFFVRSKRLSLCVTFSWPILFKPDTASQ